MANLMSNTIALQSKVMSAAYGELSDDEQSSLVEEVRGAFNGIPVLGVKIVRLADARNWRGLFGALGTYIDVETASSQKGNVTAQSFSSATSTVNIDMTAVIDVQRAIYASTEINDADKARLVELMRETIDAAQRKEPVGVAEKLREWLEVSANLATVMQVIGPFLMTLGTLLGNNPPAAG